MGYEIREDTQPAGEDVFRLLEQPSPEELDQVEGVIAVCSLLGGNAPMSVLWPGVAENGENNELVSPIDLAPTLAAIAGLDVRRESAYVSEGTHVLLKRTPRSAVSGAWSKVARVISMDSILCLPTPPSANFA